MYEFAPLRWWEGWLLALRVNREMRRSCEAGEHIGADAALRRHRPDWRSKSTDCWCGMFPDAGTGGLPVWSGGEEA